MPFFSLSDLGLAASSSQLLANWLAQMQISFPGYAPSASNLEYVQAQIFTSLAADLAQLCAEGATELFRTYATTLVGLPYQQGVAAQALITINAIPAPNTIGTTTQNLSTGGNIVGIPVVALQYGIAAGTITITDPTLAHTQTFTTSGANAGDTFVSVTSETPTYAYPIGSTLSGVQAYLLPALSQFSLDVLGFVNLAPATINSGTSQTITLTAVQTGQIFNGAGQGGSVQSVQQLPWVTTLALFTPASGGQDPEDDAHYLNRVTTALQLQAPRPITATDYGIMAENFSPYPGTDQQEVGRATSIDGYNPVDGSYGNERMVTVAVTDDNGFALNSDTLYGYPGGTSTNVIATVPNPNAGWGIAGWLQSLREITFVVNVINPTYSPVYVTVTVKGAPGYDALTVQQNVQSALLSYLSPPNWGIPLSSGFGYQWANSTTVNQSALLSVIQAAAGVSYIAGGTLYFDVVPTPSNQNDLTLPGPIALPTSTVVTIPTSGITVF